MHRHIVFRNHGGIVQGNALPYHFEALYGFRAARFVAMEEA